MSARVTVNLAIGFSSCTAWTGRHRGYVIFAKNIEAKVRLQDQWKDTEKKYLAVVHGQCAKMSGTITTYLAENKAHIVYSTSDRTKGKLSTTGYKVLKQTKDSALLELDLWTGRKHQIRVHLAGIGHAVIGDRKYGKEDRDHTRLSASCEIDFVQTSFQPTATHF